MGFREEGKWWVSPSNYDEEVISKFEFPEKIEFPDITLRDGGHIDLLVLVDTFGVLSPEGVAHRVRKLRAAFPGLPIELYFHDDFAMGVSTAIAGSKIRFVVCAYGVMNITDWAEYTNATRNDYVINKFFGQDPIFG